ncbi:acetylcholine receptor subunit beta-like [Ylistrum balloti]|uniref:acetylcholine receptor subunit beta-like n=1 Tax=Ylistrum balloti TaxID=509963 RepID=UPI002905BC3C|nr:acetylcholine receptor subunit beta-like [Ylistrum balloti]
MVTNNNERRHYTMNAWTFLFIFACFVCFHVNCEEKKSHVVDISYESVTELQHLLLQNYSKDFRPIHNQGKQVVIHVFWELHGINAFNEVTGEFVTSSRFTTAWVNEMMKWDQSLYNTSYIILNSANIWIPVLAFDNPTGSTDIRKEYEHGTIRCTPKGNHFFAVAIRTSTICEPDMRLYPFDRHNCTIIIYTPDYLIHEIALIPLILTDVSKLIVVSQWEATNFYSYNDDTTDYSRLAFGIEFKRKPEFVIFNLLAPVVLLCLLNITVFLLPPQSGERVSFSVTMFLSFSVYMTLISEKLPVTNPVSIFTRYLICNVTYSALILFFTVIGLRFHLAEDENEILYGCLQRLIKAVYLIFFLCGRRRRQKEDDHQVALDNKSADTVSTTDSLPPVLPENHRDLNKDKNVGDILMKDFGRLIDKFCLVFFLMMIVAGNLTFVLYIALS